MSEIHSTAIVGDKVEIGENVKIGPYSIIEDRVKIGDGVEIKPYVNILANTEIGPETQIFQNAVIGEIPQDLKFKGEETRTIIGSNTTIRESVTVNRGTKDRGKTVIGDNCLLMAYSHVAHDCLLGDSVILANSVGLGGHVTIEDWAILGGLVGVHQFVRIGRHSIIAGGYRVTKDVPPYIMAAEEPLSYRGLNVVGLKRRDFSSEKRRTLKKAYKKLYRAGNNVSEAKEKLENNFKDSEEVERLLEFLENSERGIIGS